MPRRPPPSVSLPVLGTGDRSRSRMGRRRALVLLLVHVLIAVHIGHYLIAGRSLGPLEPSEAGHSIRTGAINAGAIFFALLILSTLVFGRFFCGWACHLVAYQDAARWLLVRLGIRPRPLRSRLLLFVPLFAAYWLFAKPLVDRWLAGDPAPAASLHLTSDAFWSTFPGPLVTVLTFAVCGGLIVFVLGAKGFCTYGCPYGGLFVIADRFAPARIRVSDACDGSAECTAHCTSNVDVAREVREYGMVVDPGCMKCMDCIAACPNDALRFGLGATPPGRTRRPRALAWIAQSPTLAAALLAVLIALAFHVGWAVGLLAGVALTVVAIGWACCTRRREGDDPDAAEELLLVGTFTVAFAVLFQLYRMIPLLLAIGLAAVIAMGAMLTLRLARRRRVALQRLVLGEPGRPTPAGVAWLVLAIAVTAGLAHAATVQWATRDGVGRFETAERLRWADDPRWPDAAAAAERRLTQLDRLAPVHPRGLGRMLGEVHRWTGRPAAALTWYERDRRGGSRNASLATLALLARLELEGPDAPEPDELDVAIERATATPDVALRLAWELRRLDAPEIRRRVLERAYARHPDQPEVALRLCTDLVRSPRAGLRDPRRALEIADHARDRGGEDHAPLLGLLAWLQAEHGALLEAARTAERSAEVAAAAGDAALAADMRAMARSYREQAGSQPR